MVLGELFSDKILEDEFVLLLGKKFNLKMLKFSDQDEDINKIKGSMCHYILLMNYKVHLMLVIKIDTVQLQCVFMRIIHVTASSLPLCKC